MRRFFALTVLGLLLPGCSMFQSQAQIVDPVGPMEVEVAPAHTQVITETTETTETTNNVGIGITVNASGSAAAAVTGDGYSDNGAFVGNASINFTDPSSATTTATTTTTVTSAPIMSYCGMTLEDHGQLLEAIRSQQTQYTDPYEFAVSVIQMNVLTVDQTVAIIKTLGFEPGREEVAVAAYPQLCDPNNFYKILNILGPLTQDSVKERLGLF